MDKPDIFDLCYIYQEYRIDDGIPRQVDEYFLISADTAAITGLKEEDFGGRLFNQYERCVYTVAASSSRIPDARSIMEAVCWARKQGLSLEGTAYSGFLLNCAVDEMQSAVPESGNVSQPVYYVELYLPLKE